MELNLKISGLALLLAVVNYSKALSFDNIDYCQLGCTNGFTNIQHVKCDREPDSCGPHSRCENFSEIDITPSLAKFITQEHNKWRNLVALGLEKRGKIGPQPTASNMNSLRYNEELGSISQCWANTCQMKEHSHCNRATNLYYVGQNMALRSYSWPGGLTNVQENIKLMIQSWYGEVELFNKTTVPKFKFDPAYGHYTQMIWGTTEELGCGVSHYTRGGWYTILMVCNYGSHKISGNTLDNEIYKTGKPCSQCPYGRECSAKYKGLCGVIKQQAFRGIDRQIPPSINKIYKFK